jgi:hypothetical protein
VTASAKMCPCPVWDLIISCPTVWTSLQSIYIVSPRCLSIYVCFFYFLFLCRTWWSRGSSGSIVSDYGLDNRGSIPSRGKGFLF